MVDSTLFEIIIWNPSGCFWLFAPKFLEVAGTYELSIHMKSNAASMVLTMWGGEDTQTQLDGKIFFELYALSGGGDA